MTLHSFSSSEIMCDLFSRPAGQEMLSCLADCQKLVAVSLVNNEGSPDGFMNPLPSFRGLQKLELLGMALGDHARDREIAGILELCPDIHDLSLSTVSWAMEAETDLLPGMIQSYNRKTEQTLRLRSLRLGYGFLPVQSSPDYLSKLTDLSKLETLRLDNDNVGIATAVVDSVIDVGLFASASSVTSLTAERLSRDVEELIDLLNTAGQLIDLSIPRFCDTQPRARMDENNEFWDPERYDEAVEDLPQWDPTQQFSQPIEEAGRHWRKLSIGDIFHATKLSQEVLDCVGTYEQLEELTLPLPKGMWPRFRDDTLPHLRSLQRLFLVGGDNACGYGYEDHVPDYDDFVTRTLQEYNQLVQEHDAEFANHMAHFARDIFQANRESIAQGDTRALFKYLGLSEHVYTCGLLPTNAINGLAPFSIEKAGQRWDYHVIKLGSDEAAAFNSIQEWHEGMTTLRVGGDDSPEW